MRRALGILFALASFMVILPALPAAAHHAPDFGPRWQTDLRPQWAFTPSVPPGEWRNRITEAANRYNVLNESLQYVAWTGRDFIDRDPRTS